MDALTIHEAAETTGWSPRMLRYIERVGLLDAARSEARLPPVRRRRAPAPAHAARAAAGLRHRPGRDGLRPAPAHRPRPAGLRRRLVRGPAAAPRRRPRQRLAALRAGQARAPAGRGRRPRHDLRPRLQGHDDHHRHADRERLQGRRPLPGRVRPQRDPSGRARDARADEDARGVRRFAAAEGRADHGLAAHDRADRRAHRDADLARRRGPLGLVQHLLHPGPRGRGGRRRPRRHARGSAGRPGLRLEGRDARGVLVVHRAGADLAGRRGSQHDPRRRRRRHDARPQGHRVREGRRRAGSLHGRLGGVPRLPHPAAAHALRGPAEVDADRRGHPGRHRGDDDRRASPLRAGPAGRAAVPGDQRQRLGHQVEVRQPLRLPALAHRRHQPRDRRDDRRQGRRHPRLRRRRQGLRGVAARPGRARHRHRDRPDLRPAGRDGGLPGGHAGGRRRERRHLHHRHRQQGHHHLRPHGAHEAPGDRRQHRPLRQRDRHRRPREHRRHPARDDQAAGRRVGLPRRPRDHRAVRGAPAEPRQRDRPPVVRDVQLVHEPDDRPDRAVHQERRVRQAGLRAAQAPRREGRAPAPRQPRGQAHASSPPSRPPTSACRSRARTSPTTTATSRSGRAPGGRTSSSTCGSDARHGADRRP